MNPYTCYTLVRSGFHRRSTQIPGWVFTDIWETLFTLLPWSAIAHSTVSPFAWEGHNWIGNQSPWSGSSDPFHRPAHSVAACFLRLPPFRGRWGRLGLGFFCPVLPVLLPFSRGSVSTLFDFTISILIFLEVWWSSKHLGFRGRLFPLGRAYKYAACIFCNTWFQIPCWQIVHVHINTIMTRLSYSSPPFNTKIHCKLVYIYIYFLFCFILFCFFFFSWTWFWPNVLIDKFPLEPFYRWIPFLGKCCSSKHKYFSDDWGVQFWCHRLLILLSSLSIIYTVS